ncbi:MAG: tRNA lysidine(34) synthetase TilS [Alphaproteobacteria bacterium]|nr:tRNA lysidine(34) synthetase TilS [Alphaproteobacteria bacterium]
MNDLQERFNVELTHILKQNNLQGQKLAAAVSGGADSLALVFLLKRYAEIFNLGFVVLTVHHHLRPEADEETDYVANLMKKNNILHRTLHWLHEEINTGIETKARKARYDLLSDWCKQNGYNLLLTAHHLRDQAETFFIRLQRGSGVDGLSSMAKISERNGIKILRPLLNVAPKELRDFLIAQNIEWREDASNDCDDFLRVRIRKMLPLMEKELGINIQKIGATIDALSGIKEYFSQAVSRFIKSQCKNWYNEAYSFGLNSFSSLHKEIKYRALAKMIIEIGGAEYAPEYSELQRLQDMLSADDFNGCTLGGCELIKFHNKIWIIKEDKKNKIIQKKQWEEYAQKYLPELKTDIPYKLKLNLYGKAVEFEK